MAAEDVANLSLKVNTGEVEAASKTLGFFKTQAEQAAGGATEFSQSAEAMAARIKEVNDAAAAQDNALNKMGGALEGQRNQYRNLSISQGQYTQAVRMLPAQMSDIASQLSTGASPFTILIQQGGQIKDSFGGVGNTFRALLNVINPVTVGVGALAAVLAGVTYEAYKLDSQFDDVNKTIIMTGGYGYQTAQQLQEAAERISQATGTSVSDVTDLLVQMQQSGKYSKAAIEDSAKAIQEWKRAFGDTKDLEAGLQKLTTDPVKGLETLNEKFHFVTPAVMEHVIALQKAGDAAGATAAALAAVGDMAEARSKQMQENASEMSKAWSGLKSMATEVAEGLGKALIGMTDQVIAGFDLLYESVKGILLDVDKLARQAVNGTIDQIRKLPGMSDAFADAYTNNQQEIAKGDQQIIANRKEITRLQQVLNRTVKEQYDATHGAQSQTAANATTPEQDRQTKELVDNMNKKTKAAKAFQEDAGQKLLDQLNMQTEQLKEQEYIYANHLTDGKAMTQEQTKYVQLLSQINVLEARQKGGERLTQEQQQVLAVKDQALAIAKRNADESAQLDILKKQSEQHKQINDAISEMQQKREALLNTAGMSTQEAARELELITAQNKLRRAGASDFDINRYTEEVKAGFEQQDAMRDDWFNGLSSGWKTAADEAGDVYSQMQKFGKDTFDGMSNSLSNFFLTGKGGWKDFADNAISQLMRILTNSALSDLTKAFSSMGGWSAIGSGIAGLFGYAKGGVFDEPSIHALSGGVYNQPTMFQYSGRSMFANGGVLGEAGPEAVMPLTRGADGKLGVKASGGSGGSQFSIHTDVSVSTSGGGGSNQDSSAMANALGNQMTDAASGVVQRAILPGGMIYNFVKGG